MKKTIVISLMIVGLFACSDKQEVSTEDTKFNAYLKHKNINITDKSRKQRLYDEYLKKQQLAIEIEKTALLDEELIAVQVDEYKNQLLISSYFDKYLSDNVTEEGVQNFYTANIDNYQSRKIEVSHILLRTNERMSEQERQALLTSAHETYSKIRAGEDFSQLASEVSQDAVSAAKGGKLGWINEGAVSKEFSSKAFALEKGQVTEPFSTIYGFHIVKALSSPQKVTKSLESVKGDILYQLRSQAKTAEISRLLGISSSEKE